MPKNGYQSTTVPEIAFNRWKDYLKEHRKELASHGVTSVGTLVAYMLEEQYKESQALRKLASKIKKTPAKYEVYSP